ncbi:MAG TPA: PP2C family serine/threonine-protein phosphatase [Pyrinomonadaceae bacterium]|jgi:protein phosphatase|nr:PP2C family serine/threonine-protein phosphatase [Pyrinomonadaceae bacterium]
MSQPDNQFADTQPGDQTLQASAVTDRGLNEKRPLNEDSFLSDSERGIFSVADGVGGAEAGEVASQTAIEVLDAAFRHKLAGADIEDLMELAIQSANASIHKMAQDHASFSMMATTIVALHVQGNIATFGHVGDSRLYRLTPAGQLIRETADHSVVEEEVRAGRMTPEQAAHHPSKNVISRALGAESDVEVDMKVIEVDEGTQFLLCTDGITRHIPDHELRHLLITHDDLPALCDELKRLCYERGAEDNLTAVVVSIGPPLSANDRVEDLEKTIQPETRPIAAVASSLAPQTILGTSFDSVPAASPVASSLSPSDVPTETPDRAPVPEFRAASLIDNRLDVAPPARTKSGVERTMTRFFIFVLFLGLVAAAFYAGRKYKGPIPYVDPAASVADVSPTPVVGDDPILKFERSRREVDNDPRAWLATQMQSELTRQQIKLPLESSDAEFLYLYGRASLLTGNIDQAGKAFDGAIAKANLPSPQANATLKKEATLGLAAVALNSDKDRPAAQTRFGEILTPPPSQSPSPASGSPSP